MNPSKELFQSIFVENVLKISRYVNDGETTALVIFKISGIVVSLFLRFLKRNFMFNRLNL